MKNKLSKLVSKIASGRTINILDNARFNKHHLLFAVLCSFVSVAIHAEASHPAINNSIDFQGVSISPAIPPDVVLTQANRQRDMDIFSWNSFVALNWPDNANGYADKSSLIGQTTSGDHSTVWENWISTSDIFNRQTASEPTWGQRFVPKLCSDNSDYRPNMKILDQASKSDDFFEEAFDAGPLVDQSGNFVRYEILINEDMFNTIKKNKLYKKSQQKKATTVSFNCGDNGNGNQGAIMIKAAWKIMTAKDNSSRYHTDSAMVFTPAKYRSDNRDNCEKKRIGLVGMHVVHKTVKQPQWIWSSFEQRDNLPDCENQNTFFTNPSQLNTPTCPATSAKHYSFYASLLDKNKMLNSTKNSLNQTNCNIAPKVNSKEGKYNLDKKGISSQLCRENALETSAPPVNTAYQTLLGSINHTSVWQHYQLIGTQWNSNIKSSCGTDTTYVETDVLPQYKMKKTSKGIVPLPLANSTMEGYEQGNSSCIGCHSSAEIKGKTGKVASDFVWFLSQEVE